MNGWLARLIGMFAVDKLPVTPTPEPIKKKRMLNDTEIIAKYGQPGDPDNLTSLVLPYPMKIAWDLSKTVTKIQCHKLIAEPLRAVFNDLLAHYGLQKLQELGIDLFGGCVAIRLMRGSKSRWSSHSWGIAIDLHPAKNQLKQTKSTALFAKPEYKPLMDIFYKHGFFNLGVEKNYDFMHFQIAS